MLDDWPPSYHIVYLDHAADDCDGGKAIAIGYGWSSDDLGMPNALEAEVSGRCLKRHQAYDGEMFTLTYMTDGDMLEQRTSAGGVIFWKRQGQFMDQPK